MDKKAKKILFNTYWSSKGWKDEHYTSPEDFAYVKEKGLMFDPLTISHDDCIRKIVNLANTITIDQVAKAFISSLSTRRLEWRSAIASHYVAKQFTEHQFVPIVSGYSYDQETQELTHTSYTCDICCKSHAISGDEYYEDEDLNVLNFERIKWGGVRLGKLIYTLFDLERFIEEKIPEPTHEDIEIFKAILNASTSCKPNDHPGALRKKLAEISGLKANQAERSCIIEILACMGVLKPKSYDRTGSSSRSDWIYADQWRGEDGYDHASVDKYFGKYLS